MNKQDLIAALANETGSTQADAGSHLDALVSVVTKALQRGDSVQLVGFGSFSVSKRKATTGRNPRTGEPIQIPAKNVVKFSPGKNLKESVN